MKKLHLYWETLTADQKRLLAERCGTTVNYLSKVVSVSKRNKRKRLGADLAVKMERATGGQIRVEDVTSKANLRLLALARDTTRFIRPAA